MFFNCTSKLLVIQEHKKIGNKKNYCVQVYELNPENFSDLDENNMQGERLNTINPRVWKWERSFRKLFSGIA